MGAAPKQLADTEYRLYLRFKNDETQEHLAGPYQRTHPEDNEEAQPIHEHGDGRRPLPAPPSIAGRAAPKKTAAQVVKKG